MRICAWMNGRQWTEKEIKTEKCTIIPEGPSRIAKSTTAEQRKKVVDGCKPALALRARMVVQTCITNHKRVQTSEESDSCPLAHAESRIEFSHP